MVLSDAAAANLRQIQPSRHEIKCEAKKAYVPGDFRFSHVLVRDVLYDELSSARRAERAVTRALELARVSTRERIREAREAYRSAVRLAGSGTAVEF